MILPLFLFMTNMLRTQVYLCVKPLNCMWENGSTMVKMSRISGIWRSDTCECPSSDPVFTWSGPKR